MDDTRPQVAEHNPASLRDMETLGTVWRKRHRRYRWTL